MFNWTKRINGLRIEKNALQKEVKELKDSKSKIDSMLQAHKGKTKVYNDLSKLTNILPRIQKAVNSKRIMYLVRMQMRSGSWHTFTVAALYNTFEYKGGLYIIDEDFTYKEQSSKLPGLDYHQDLILPVRRRIPARELKDNLKEVSDIENTINPVIAKEAMESKVIEMALRSQQISEIMQFIKKMSILIAIVGIIHLILYLKQSGVLDNLW